MTDLAALGFGCAFVGLVISMELTRRYPLWVIGVVVNTVMLTLLAAKIVGLIA